MVNDDGTGQRRARGRGLAVAQVHGAGWGMEELLSSGWNWKKKAAGRWSLTRPVEDVGFRQGSSGSWIERGAGNRAPWCFAPRRAQARQGDPRARGEEEEAEAGNDEVVAAPEIE